MEVPCERGLTRFRRLGLRLYDLASFSLILSIPLCYFRSTLEKNEELHCTIPVSLLRVTSLAYGYKQVSSVSRICPNYYYNRSDNYA